MNFSFCRTAGRAVAVASIATVLAAKPLPAVAAPARFPTANGIVKYRMTMGGQMVMNNDITMTWADYGALFRQDSQVHMTIMGRQMTMNSWSLYDGKSLYASLPSGMPGQASGRKVALRTALPRDYFKRMTMGNSPLTAGGGRLAGHGTVLGKVCEIRVLDLNNPGYTGQAKIWMWQKLPLRSEISMNMRTSGGTRNMKMSMVATQLNTNVKPSPLLFRLPAGYQIKEMGRFQKRIQDAMRQRMQQRNQQH